VGDMENTPNTSNASEEGHDYDFSDSATSNSSDSLDSDCSINTIVGKCAYILYKKYYGDPDVAHRRSKFQHDTKCDTPTQNDVSLSPPADDSGENCRQNNFAEMSASSVEEDAVIVSSHRDVQAECCEEGERHVSHGMHVSETCHDKTKRFACTYCEKACKHRFHLTTHERRHRGEKLHCCDHCQKCFVTMCELKSHVRTHTGECPYLCAVCGKLFKFVSQLNYHQRTHTGVKPFKCSECNKAFSNSNI